MSLFPAKLIEGFQYNGTIIARFFQSISYCFPIYMCTGIWDFTIGFTDMKISNVISSFLY